MIKIGVIGSINRDTIRFPDGIKSEGWGGMLYNLVTFSYLLGEKSHIFPVCNLGSDVFDEVIKIIDCLPGISREFFNRVPERNNHCFLSYIDYERKTEILKGGVRPLKFSDVQGLLECDFILLNYISGRDIYLNSLKKLRRLYRGKIYVDVHSYTLGKRSDGSRYWRRPSGWMQVLLAADYIRMNRQELHLLVESKATGYKERDIYKECKMIHRGLQKIDQRGINRILIITDGGNGCFLSYCCGREHIFKHFAVSEVIDRGNVTGCGDCFSAGFLVSLAVGKGDEAAAVAANRVAGGRLGSGRERYSVLRIEG